MTTATEARWSFEKALGTRHEMTAGGAGGDEGAGQKMPDRERNSPRIPMDVTILGVVWLVCATALIIAGHSKDIIQLTSVVGVVGLLVRVLAQQKRTQKDVTEVKQKVNGGTELARAAVQATQVEAQLNDKNIQRERHELKNHVQALQFLVDARDVELKDKAEMIGRLEARVAEVDARCAALTEECSLAHAAVARLTAELGHAHGRLVECEKMIKPAGEGTETKG